MSKDAKRKPLNSVRAALNKKIATALIDLSAAARPCPALPSGVRAIDELIGIGGWPRGSACEVFGRESSGKSTLAIQTCAQAQKLGGVAAYLDYEQSTTPEYMRSLGVDTDAEKMLYAQPETVEQGFQLIEELLEAHAVDVIVWDSVAVSACAAELADDYSGVGVSPKPKILAARMRRVAARLGSTALFPNPEEAPVLLFVNHAQVTLNTMARWGQEILRTPGGDFLKYFARVRLMTAIRGTVKGKVTNPLTGKPEETAIGRRIRVKLVKSKVSPPLRTADVLIRFGQGLSNTDTMIEEALRIGTLERKGTGQITWPGQSAGAQKWRSMNELEAALRDDEELWGALAVAVGWEEAYSGKIETGSEAEISHEV